MSNLLAQTKRHKSLLLTLLGLLLLPFILPLITVLVKILFTSGSYLGTLVRYISEGSICF